MKKFNLAQIVPSLKSGGVEQGTIDVANNIANIEKRNFIISNGGPLQSYLNKKYVQHYKLPVHTKNFLLMPFLGKKIQKLIITNNINILHVRSRAPSWILPFINVSNLIKVSTFHNVYNDQNIIKKIYNKGLNNVDYIVAISKYVKEEIISKYKIDTNKITVINRGIDINFFCSKINETEFLKFINSFKIPTNKKIILFPGRLTKWKGQIEFLSVIEKFKNKPYIFYFVGDDKNISYTKKLVNLIDKKDLINNCHILGHLDRNQLKLMYHCADLVISAPLRPEGFGRTISESLVMKKIILSYNFGGAKNQLDDLDNLYKITPNKLEELQIRIEKIFNMPEPDLKKIKLFGKQHVLSKFSKEQMLKSYMELYRNISF